QELADKATSNLFADILETPAVQTVARRLENGGVLSCTAVSQAAQPFFAALLRQLFPTRPIVVVTDSLKTQESFQADLETWFRVEQNVSTPRFYPAWETLPHEAKLPHADTITDRLQTLVALSASPEPGTRDPELIVSSVTALLQRTFAPETLRARIRSLTRGDRIDPLDLVEWLEEQGYEPEAQVTQKGEIALRGGILDVYPLTSPWPVRLEFFGDELESLRYFDPFSQMSKEEITEVTIPPAGELGLLKKMLETKAATPPSKDKVLATLLDYLPAETIFLFCEPASL